MACSGEPECVPNERTLVATSAGWSIVDASEDPFTDRPAMVACIPEAIAVEGPAVEIDTGGCSYVTLRQETVAVVQQCDVVHLTIAHAPLFADEPATAHVVFRIGDEVLVDKTVPIPSETGVFEIVRPMGLALPVGTPLFFHLHNHGENSWFVTDVRIDPSN